MSTHRSPPAALLPDMTRPDAEARPPVGVRPGARIAPDTFDAACRVSRHHAERAERDASRSVQAHRQARPDG